MTWCRCRTCSGRSSMPLRMSAFRKSRARREKLHGSIRMLPWRSSICGWRPQMRWISSRATISSRTGRVILRRGTSCPTPAFSRRSRWLPRRSGPLAGRSPTHGTRAILYRARIRRSAISQYTCELFTPHRDGRGALHHRPLVLVDVDDGVAVRRAAFPRGAETVLGQLPSALALSASPVLRLARDLAVGGKRHLELGPGGGRCGERLAVEELGLDFLRRELAGGKRRAGQKGHKSDARKHGTHLILPNG